MDNINAASNDYEELNKEVLELMDKTKSDYYYNWFSTIPDGDVYQELYKCIDKFCRKVMTDYENDYYSIESLTLDVSQDVLEMFLNSTDVRFLDLIEGYRRDNPMIYFIHASYLYRINADNRIYLDINYQSASERYDINKKLCKKIKEYASLANGAETEYTKTRIFNDVISDNMYYLYDENGNFSKEDFAHNILGFFLYGKGVCETYAYTFSVLMNYCGGECLYVNGYAGSIGHAWNIAKMDDGKWYWFDVTSNDNETDSASLSMFCINNLNYKMDNPRYLVYYSDQSLPEISDSNIDVSNYYYYNYQGVKYFINYDVMNPIEKDESATSLPDSIILGNKTYKVECKHVEIVPSAKCKLCTMCN